MNLPKYQYRTNEGYLDYEFISEGPKGRIKKVVRFLQISSDVYNLGFGDLDEVTGEISDTVITDNKDSQKVLATVASTIYDFYGQYPGTRVLVKGNTLARTRLYRIGITNNWKEISMDFEVHGLKNGEWELFQFRKDYEAFLIEPAWF
jgi:hypothetical protein